MQDLLITGRIHTLDPSNPEAGAALIRGDRFACVGDAATCGERAGAGARRIDLGRGSAVPGLADAHGHVLGQGLALPNVSCLGAPTEEACAGRVAERARRTPRGQWLLGRGWDQSLWPGGRFPTEAALDQAAPDHPVLLERVDGHAAWANSRALALARIVAGTADPEGGRILRHQDGRPTGVLVDTAVDLVRSRIPPPTRDEIEQAVLPTLGELVRAGLTSIHDAGVGRDGLEAYRKLAQEDRLPVRVYAMIDGQVPRPELDDQMRLWRATPEVGRLTVRAVKLFADGALGSRGAALLEPYQDDPASRGLLVTPAAELRERIRMVAIAGFQPAVHAIGDRACAQVLDDFEAAAGVTDLASLRPRLEHAQVLPHGAVALFRRTGAVASMQPTHATSDAPWAEARLGRARLGRAYAWKDLLDGGVPLAFGSDFPVESFDPRAGLHAAETRLPRGWPRPFLPEQRLTRQQALRAFTTGAALAERAEARRGMIREGYDADLTAFDGDILGVAPEELERLGVTLTVVGGRVEYRR
jgi:predicted amidohydrolase YtcJ